MATPTAPTRGEWGFVLAVWLASRAVVALVMAALAPHLPVPPGGHPVPPGLEVFAGWDGGWYLKVAASGYEFAADGRQHDVAFFPLYPLAIRAFAAAGVPAVAAGVLVANEAMLGALAVTYAWVRDRLGAPVARWAVALLALCPYALFTTVVYSEGLFLLLSAAALAAFDRGRYALAAGCGALAGATRVPGVALAPAMLWAAWRERRGARALLAAAGTLVGPLAYMAFLAACFGDPVAFMHAQAAWHSAADPTWLDLLRRPGVHEGGIKLVMVVGGAALLVACRDALPPVAVGYGFAALAVVVASGTTISVDRYAYGILPFGIALAIAVARRPRIGGAVLVGFTALLIAYALRFARGLWVA